MDKAKQLIYHGMPPVEGVMPKVKYEDIDLVQVNAEFLGDTTGLLRPGLTFEPQPAWEKVRDGIVARLLPVK